MLKCCGLLLICCGLQLCAADTTWITNLGGSVERDSGGRVVAVNLRGAWISDVQMIELARLPDLERLDLSHTRITDEGMLNLKPAPKISELKLFYSEWITDQGMRAIKEWKHLKRLDLRGTRISDSTLEIVGGLTSLEALDIAHTEVTDYGLENLITLDNLKELSLGKGHVTTTGFAKVRSLPGLTYLDIGGAQTLRTDNPNGRSQGAMMPEETLKAFAELKALRVLNLGFSQVNVDGLRILSALEHVEKLRLQGCPRVDDAALQELAKWKSLKYLDVEEDPVTEKGLAALRSARLDLKTLSGGTPPPPPAPYNR
jgi:Leucine-rich repeat (LRR) protein